LSCFAYRPLCFLAPLTIKIAPKGAILPTLRNTAIDAAELAGYAQKLGVKLQSLCGSGFSLFAVFLVAKAYHLGVN